MRALSPHLPPLAVPHRRSRTAQRRRSAPSAATAWTAEAAEAAAATDEALSLRSLSLDPAGYFLIHARHAECAIVVEHYCNSINAQGLACDPRTGDVIPCTGYVPPLPPRTFRGATAKAVAVAILEAEGAEGCCSRLEHAAYLGRELQRAEQALRSGVAYVQD